MSIDRQAAPEIIDLRTGLFQDELSLIEPRQAEINVEVDQRVARRIAILDAADSRDQRAEKRDRAADSRHAAAEVRAHLGERSNRQDDIDRHRAASDRFLSGADRDRSASDRAELIDLSAREAQR